MTSEDLEDKYPHWKDALFGNHNAVANLRCAIHYVFWHSVYALIALVGIVVIGAVKIAKTVSQPLGPYKEPIHNGLDRFLTGVNAVLNHEYTKKVGDVVFGVFVVGMFLFLVGMGLWLLYTEFWMTVKAVVVGVALFAGLILGIAAIDKVLPRLTEMGTSAAGYTASKARTAGEKAVKTPGVRRVYGECPVSVDMAPKWFDNLFPDEEY